MRVTLLSISKKIEINPIGFVKRSSPDDEKDRSLVSKIELKNEFAKGLEGIEDWSHIYVIFWMHEITGKNKVLIHPGGGRNVGVFATRAPIRPNPIGLTLVELVKHEKNVLMVRGLDALNDTPVLDIKPYPDWESGKLLVINDFRISKWLSEIVK